ncbi:unnamed protein product [Schistocephalus solidus]|uniref:DDE-1 domain-containing protein n=1 Tax=Schistocephalus solidus TaxID=70667 RepID=A0A183TE92_SCHSO|nr:unnamed protein product [Schistocephalus solidus]
MQDYFPPENQLNFLPPNITPLLQPMNQKGSANFKKLYMKALLERCIDVADTTQNFGRSISISQVDAADVQELVQEHSDEMTTEELIEPQKELNQKEVQELSSGEGEVREDAASSSEIRQVLGMCEKVNAFLEKHHPEKAVTARLMASRSCKFAVSAFRLADLTDLHSRVLMVVDAQLSLEHPSPRLTQHGTLDTTPLG